jgi:hypothetical protein
MTALYEELVRKIQLKCEEERWFGGELNKDMDPEDDPQRFMFVFATTSEEQIQDAERHLEFSLPPFLRYVYGHIANGGFGPGMGLFGIMNGFGSACDYNSRFDLSIVGFYRTLMREQAINLNEYPPDSLVDIEQKFWQFPLGTWPRYLLPLSDMGCARIACVNKDSQMFLEVAVKQGDMYGLVQLGWTFEEWIERWLNGESTTW